MIPTHNKFDVVVIGGGPAGAATATHLARQGIRVCVVEGKQFPRHHIGESLLSMSMGYIRELDVEEDLIAHGALRKYGSLFRWGTRSEPLILGQTYPGYAYQVKRAEFDNMLLRRAEAEGATVRESHWARDIVCDGTRLTGVRGTGPDGEFHIGAKIVVDASGLPQLIPRRLGLRPGISGPRRVAISGYFTGAGRPKLHHENDIVTEFCTNGWMWFIPLDRNLASVGFVTDAGTADHQPERTLAREIARTGIVSGLLAAARPSGHARVLRYTNHIIDDNFWQRGCVLVGDTAAFIDPLFSTGVHGALHSAALASAGIASVLRGDIYEEEAASWYDRRMREHFVRVATLIQILYRLQPGESPFWARRYDPIIPKDEAETALLRLGSSGIAFLADTVRNGTLMVPSTLSDRFAEFSRAARICPLPPEAVVSLTPETVIGHDLTRSPNGLATRAVTLTHQRNRTKRGEWSADSAYARLVAAINGRSNIADLAERSGLRVAGRTGASNFVGALVQSGHLRVLSSLADADTDAKQ